MRWAVGLLSKWCSTKLSSSAFVGYSYLRFFWGRCTPSSFYCSFSDAACCTVSTGSFFFHLRSRCCRKHTLLQTSNEVSSALLSRLFRARATRLHAAFETLRYIDIYSCIFKKFFIDLAHIKALQLQYIPVVSLRNKEMYSILVKIRFLIKNKKIAALRRLSSAIK